MRWALWALLFTCCQAPRATLADRRAAIERILSNMADHLAAIDSSVDFERMSPQLEADYLDFAKQLQALKALDARAPSTESLEFLQMKERLDEHLGRIRDMEGGVEWLRQVQRPAHRLLIQVGS